MTQYRIPVEETFSWQRPVEDKDLATPPATPAKGDRYIVAATATGDWATHEKDIAWCSNATGPVWSFDTPVAGWQTYAIDENRFYKFNGTSWAVLDEHSRQHDITSTADHTSSATPGRVLKADANGLPVDATNTDAQVASAVTNSHVQGTDQGLDTGGPNAVTAAQTKEAYDRRGSFDADLGAILMNLP